jgi:hypothetical protein
MEIHPDAPANPLYDELNDMLDYERQYPDVLPATALRTI